MICVAVEIYYRIIILPLSTFLPFSVNVKMYIPGANLCVGIETLSASGLIARLYTLTPFNDVTDMAREPLSAFGRVITTGTPRSAGFGDAEIRFSSQITLATPDVLSIR